LIELRRVNHHACEHCRSPSITFPNEINDAAVLYCAGCEASVGTWYDFKERTRAVILGEIERGEVSFAIASSDIRFDQSD